MDISSCYKYLDWDSDFFSFPVGHAELSEGSKNLLSDILEAAQHDDLALLIVNSAEPLDVKIPYPVSLVDQPLSYEIDYQREHFWKDSSRSDIKTYTGPNGRAELDELAKIAGAHSRYYFDPLFPKSDADRLFVAWVDRALSDPDQMLHVANDEAGKIIAMLISRIKTVNGRDVGNPALLSVAPDWRGKNFTQQFCKASCDWFLTQGITRGYVVTQHRNSVARRIYESLNWVKTSENYCYHIWFQPQTHGQTS